MFQHSPDINCHPFIQ